jgi:serine/threonine protein kinase
MPRAPDLSGLALDGRYELHAVIGEGTFGRVYRGRDRRLARPVAVKVIKPWWSEDPDWVKTFEREAQLLASVSDPGIVQIFDVGSAPEGLYYVAELVEGESLAARLRRGRPSPEEARDVAEQLARALSKAHAQRVVHRDVKPANVLISRDGRIKVGDFGVAHLAEGSSEGAAGTIAGTPKYMAPEQARGQATTPATDVYGVGIVLYEMLAGAPPFEGSSSIELALRHVHDEPPSLPRATPPVLVRITWRALAKDPFHRFANGRALADALADAREELDADRDDEPHRSGGGGGVATLTPPVRAVPARPPHAAAARPPRLVAQPQASGSGSSDRRGRVEPTVLGEPMSSRRNVNPSARRRRLALVGFVLLLAAGMGAGAIALAPGHLNVPNLHGMSRGRILTRAKRMDFTAAFGSRYSSAPKGSAIAQSPRHGIRVLDGTTVSVVLSAGPPPVKVPKLVGARLTDARATLRSVRLVSSVSLVPAPRVSPGTVTAESPRGGSTHPVGTKIALSVAEVPKLRPLTHASGDGDGRTVVFQIRGAKWNLITTMAYEGNCTFLFVCSGPSATVTDITSGKPVDQFGLDEAPGVVRTITSGPGLYQVTVSAGSDSARWGVKVDDYY